MNGYKYGTIDFNQAEAQHTWQVGAQNTLVMGAEFQQQAIDYLIDNPNGSTTTVNKDVNTASLYGQDEVKLLNDLTLVGGFRFDDHSVFGSEINPKLSAMYSLSDSTSLRASAGRAFKSPTIRQLYYDIPYRHGDYYNQSNPDLKPEVGMGYSASIEQWLLDGQLMTRAQVSSAMTWKTW
ncbi:MAG: TonB-dependent receptor plug domain-containing protein [Candidatus Electronema sp. VV]